MENDIKVVKRSSLLWYYVTYLRTLDSARSRFAIKNLPESAHRVWTDDDIDSFLYSRDLSVVAPFYKWLYENYPTTVWHI